MYLPHVIGIGTRRCGSSWVHHVLNGHPQIGKPVNGLHFFSEKFDKGLDWYAMHFEPFVDRQVLLEFSVSYLYPEYADVAAQRIATTLGKPKLFVCLRDPVSRAFSDYLRSVRMQELPAGMSFEQAIADHPIYLERGLYAQLLRPYFDHFGAESIKALFFEDLEADRQSYIDQLTEYLGLSLPVPPEAMRREEPKGKSVRSPVINTLVHRTKDLADNVAEKVGLSDSWSNWKGRHMQIYEKALELNHRAIEIQPETVKKLRQVFETDIVELEKMTGRDLRKWRDEG